MASESNALAELAEALEILKVILENEHHPKGFQAADKAQRIVAELAKVQDEEAALLSMENITADEARRIVRQREGNCILKSRAIAEEGAGDGASSVVPDSDMRLAHYYLTMHRSMLENMRIGYMKRYEDSDGLFTNEKAKADHVACDIRTIDAWIERHKDHHVDESNVNHMNGDYSTKNVIEF